MATKKDFSCEFWLFLGKKWPKKNCKKLQSKPTCGPPRGSELFNNQPEHFPGARGRHTRKKEEKRTVWQWVANVMGKIWKLPGKQQSNLPPLALLEGWELVFFLSLLKRREERKERNKNHVSLTFFNYLGEYYLLLLWHTPSWWGWRRVFVKLMFSSERFAYQKLHQ